MTNILLKGSALGALAVALGFSAIPASAAPAVDFDAPMVAIDTGVSAQAAELAQDRDQYRRGRSERSERRQVLRERAAAPDAAVAPARAQRAQEARRAEGAIEHVGGDAGAVDTATHNKKVITV